MRCVVHIGCEKTGTTLLQRWLYQNQAALSEHGIALSDCLDKPENRKLCAYFQTAPDDYFLDRQLSNPTRRSQYFTNLLQDFSAEVATKSVNHDCFVITSEHFHSRLRTLGEIEKFGAYLKSIFSRVEIVGYFREQSAVRDSLYSTELRSGYWGAIEGFQRDLTPSDPYYNYYTLAVRWAKVFGRNAIKAVLYNRSEFSGGDLRRDFLERVSPGLSFDAFDPSVKSANEKFTQTQVILARAVNSVHRRYLADGTINDQRWKMIYEIDALRDDSKLARRIIDPLPIYERFSASNIKFANEFLGRSSHPFAKPAPLLSTQWPNAMTWGMEDELVRAYARLLLPLVDKSRLRPTESLCSTKASA